ASYLLHPGRDGGGSSSGTNTPHERNESDILASTNTDATFTPPATNAGTAAPDTEYFRRPTGETGGVRPAALQNALAQKHDSEGRQPRTVPQRKPTLPEDIERWVRESGMGRGRHADALGDEPELALLHPNAEGSGSGPGSRNGEQEEDRIPEEEEERELEDEGGAQVIPGKVRQEVLEAEEVLRREAEAERVAEESVRLREEERAERVKREIEEEERRERGVRESVY
ncbi:hypothetical protein KC352_g36872, partial [Hortaea werneckii]